MSTGRVLLAGVIAGIALFFWMAIVHVATGVAAIGVSELPNESAVLNALTANQTPAGFYIFPGYGAPPNATPEQKKAAQAAYGQRYAKLPSGIMVYTPPNGQTNPMPPSRLLSELALEIIEAFLVVWLLDRATLRSFGARVAFAAVIGIVVGITTNGSYYVWYNFPANYTVVQIFSQVVGFAIVGVVGALFMRQKSAIAARA
ncbi:MAG TPA: DUF1761 family protein [Terriglobales bacterium]